MRFTLGLTTILAFASCLMLGAGEPAQVMTQPSCAGSVQATVRTVYDKKLVTERVPQTKTTYVDEEYTDYEPVEKTVMQKRTVVEKVPTTKVELKTESYIDYETRTKVVMVPKEIEEEVAVTKQRQVPVEVETFETRTREVEEPKTVVEHVAVTKTRKRPVTTTTMATRTREVVVPRQVVQRPVAVAVTPVQVQPVAVQVAPVPVAVPVAVAPVENKAVRVRPTLRQNREPLLNRRTKTIVVPPSDAPLRSPSTTAPSLQYVAPAAPQYIQVKAVRPQVYVDGMSAR